MYKDTDLILTEAASIANPFKNLASSCVLHNDSQVSGGKQNLHERERETVKEILLRLQRMWKTIHSSYDVRIYNKSKWGGSQLKFPL